MPLSEAVESPYPTVWNKERQTIFLIYTKAGYIRTPRVVRYDARNFDLVENETESLRTEPLPPPVPTNLPLI